MLQHLKRQRFGTGRPARPAPAWLRPQHPSRGRSPGLATTRGCCHPWVLPPVGAGMPVPRVPPAPEWGPRIGAGSLRPAPATGAGGSQGSHPPLGTPIGPRDRLGWRGPCVGLASEWILAGIGRRVDPHCRHVDPPPWHRLDPRYSDGIGQGRDPSTGLVSEWIPTWDWQRGYPRSPWGRDPRAQTVPSCATWGALPRSCGGGRGLRGHRRHRFGVPRGQGARGTAKPAGGWHQANPPALLPPTNRGANRATGPQRLG